MDRRQLLGLAAGAAGARLARTNGATAQSAPRSPNIVFIITDDLDSAVLTANLAQLPAIQRIATEGARFTRHVISTPICAPSRASILRGQFAHNHAVHWNRGDPVASGGFPVFHSSGDEQSTIATWLQSAGYTTALMGKYLNSYPIGADPGFVPPGWDHWVAHLAADREAFYDDYELNIDGQIQTFGDAGADYSTDVIAGKASEFIRRQSAGSAPFFLWLAPYNPHEPSTPAPRYADTAVAPLPSVPSFDETDVSDKPAWINQLPLMTPKVQAAVREGFERHGRSMLAVNDLVQTVFDALDATAQLDSTLFVFTSDNGFHFGEHRIAFGKASAYDESTIVPLFMRGPGIRPGTVIDRLTINIDFAPTFAAMAGAAIPDFVDGRDLAPLLAGDNPDDWRTVALVEQFEDIEDRPSRSGTPVSQRARENEDSPNARLLQIPIPQFAGLRGESFLWVEYVTGEREFYDLQSDPFALSNQAATLDPGAVQQLTTAVAGARSCTGSTCRTADRPDLSALTWTRPGTTASATPDA